MAATSASSSSCVSFNSASRGADSSNNRSRQGVVAFPLQLSRTRPGLQVAGPRYLHGTVIRAGTDDKSHSGTSLSAGFSLPIIPDWAKLLFGGLIWLSAPAGWNKIRDVGNMLERVDAVVETIGEVAEKADHIAEELADDLPDGGLKNAVQRVEKVSEVVASRAELIDDILDKVTEVVRKVYGTNAKVGAAANESQSTAGASHEKTTEEQES